MVKKNEESVLARKLSEMLEGAFESVALTRRTHFEANPGLRPSAGDVDGIIRSSVRIPRPREADSGVTRRAFRDYPKGVPGHPKAVPRGPEGGPTASSGGLASALS